MRFFQKALFEDNIDFGIDFGANLPPCWPLKSKNFRFLGVPRGLQNFIVFCIEFLSILAPSWPPTWGHLGGQDASKSEKKTLAELQKKVAVLPKSGSRYEVAFEDRSRASRPRFFGGQGSIFDDFGMIFRASWLTLGTFSAAHKAENPRTCRGQSREQNPYRRLQET